MPALLRESNQRQWRKKLLRILRESGFFDSGGSRTVNLTTRYYHPIALPPFLAGSIDPPARGPHMPPPSASLALFT